MLRQIGFAISILLFISPVFANQCPPAEKLISCSGGSCVFQKLSGWREIVYYTDNGKEFAFQKQRIDGREINCYYSYFDTDTHRMMPPALVLRSTIN